MKWNWQRPDWPDFTYDATAIEPLEKQFLLRSGELLGAFRHVDIRERDTLRIELISEEALRTSAIEGEILDRESLQASLRQQLGLETGGRRVSPAERGITELMVGLYKGFDEPLSHQALFSWHAMVMAGRRGIERIGGYREHIEPMQIVSGNVAKPKIHFE